MSPCNSLSLFEMTSILARQVERDKGMEGGNINANLFSDLIAAQIV